MKNIILLTFLISLFHSPTKNSEPLIIQMLEEEYWWAGLSSLGHQTPFDKNSDIKIDLWGDNKGNQAQPLLLSNKGRYIWSEEPFEFSIQDGKITVDTREGDIISGAYGTTLKSAYSYAVEHFFPPNQEQPEELMFTHPQYNTWIELVYNQNEEDILKYAQSIIDNNYPPGVIMIDDNWQENYGVWEFSRKRFQNPKAMIKKLHDLGFMVMMWVCPFVSPDSENYRYLEKKGWLIKEGENAMCDASDEGKPKIIRWWNGASACLDLSHPNARDWFKKELDHLVTEYSVDGFKFDAGDADFYTGNIKTHVDGNPNDQTTHFATLGLHYPLNEFRASWKMAGLPLAQRLRDKEHKWEDLRKLIPDMMSQSIMGYAYTCPDMIGGGEFKSFQNLDQVDEELIVRSAQVHALMPMMQFSVAPWRVLSEKNNIICKSAANLHLQMGKTIYNLAKEASETGEPIVKPMEYLYPDHGYEKINDQFILGHDIIVAPVLYKGERSRKVVLPEGRWRADDQRIYTGGQTVEIDVPLERLPYFTKL